MIRLLNYLTETIHSHLQAEPFLNAQKFFQMFLDLIWGVPSQSLDDWKKELREICKMDVSHLSLYQLTLEKGTKLFEELPHLRESHNNDLMADFYQATTQITKKIGYFQYEISSFSRSREFRSRHNIGYWNGGDFYGLDPGAHGRRFEEDGKRYRTFGVLSPNAWMTRCENEGHNSDWLK